MPTTRRPAIVPDVYRLLSGWCYLEHSLLRMWAGWGRHAGDWGDKLAVCRHVYLQSEIVDRMRRRMAMYPGGKADQKVSEAYEQLANAALLAPSWPQAMAGMALLRQSLDRAYRDYIQGAHVVHDRPTFDLLHEVDAFAREQLAWYDDFGKRYPHTIDPKYRAGIEAKLAEVGQLLTPIEPTEPYAHPCGKRTDFRLPKTPGRVRDHDQAPNVMPLLSVDWSHSVGTRRLFFCIGYMWEMGVAENQLTWIYYADFMPWDFIYAESRHMWDESRHGNSGKARLEDFGLGIADVGYDSYGVSGPGDVTPMTPQDVYHAFYEVTQIAETGYFETKRYCFADFAAGNDDESAEMMQFDIIDETSHVAYGHEWLTEMGRRAGIEEDYRARAHRQRVRAQAESDDRVAMYRQVRAGRLDPATIATPDVSDDYNPASADAAASLINPTVQDHYEHLLRVMDARKPLRNRSTAPVRPNLPM